MLKKFGIFLLFAILTIIYFRNAIFAPSSALVTRHLGTDIYGYFLIARDSLNWLRNGFVAIGNYWVPRGGGYPATPINQLIVPSNLLLTGLYAITQNFLATLRIFDPLVYFCTLVATYWYGTILFKSKTIPSMVLAVAYTFSMYGVGQLEHLDLLIAPVFIVLTLGFFEKMLDSHKASYVALTSLFAFLTYITHLYAFFFLLAFMLLRFIYEVATNPERRKVFINCVKLTILSLIATLPFLVLQLVQQPDQAKKVDLEIGLKGYAQSPGLFFSRFIPNVFTPEVTMYIGFAVILLALLPILFRKTNKKYVFYLVTTVLVMFYAIGHFSPINLAQLVHDYVPFAYFIRVPGRALIIGCLTIAICAAVGLGQLVDKMQRRWVKYVVICVAVTLIFCDFTIGYEPPTTQMVLQDNDACEYLAQQQGDFRILEIPSVHGQILMDGIYTQHDVISWMQWGYGYYEPLYSITGLYQEYVDQDISATQAAFYGVKYLIVNTDPSYYSAMSEALREVAGPNLNQILSLKDWISNDTTDYKLVYNNNNYAIYENLQYQDIVSGAGVISYTRPNPNEIKIDVNSNTPTTVQVSQSYDKGWKTNVGTLSENNSEQQLNLPSGIYTVTLKYVAYQKSLLWFLIYIPLIGAIVWMLRRQKHETQQ